jgi:hypothetical protein
MTKIGELRDRLIALLQEHERDGALPTSARFLYYELVQRGQLSKQRTGARRPDQTRRRARSRRRRKARAPRRRNQQSIMPGLDPGIHPLRMNVLDGSPGQVRR